MSQKKYQDRVAVVTGSGGTLCSAMARDLAEQGAKVALIGRTKEKLDRTKAEIEEAGGVAESFSADVTDEAQIRETARAVEDALGTPSILINGAGGNQMDAITTVDTFEAEEIGGTNPELRGFFNLGMDAFHRVVEINIMGTVIPCQVFGRQMAAAGSGVILNIASMNSFRSLTRVPAYASAKAGVENFTRWLACYLAPLGIRVNGIAPGFFPNERSRSRLMTPDGGLTPRGQKIIGNTPLGRFGEADELIGCMNWLIDEQTASFATGITVCIDGGFMASSPV